MLIICLQIMYRTPSTPTSPTSTTSAHGSDLQRKPQEKVEPEFLSVSI